MPHHTYLIDPCSDSHSMKEFNSEPIANGGHKHAGQRWQERDNNKMQKANLVAVPCSIAGGDAMLANRLGLVHTGPELHPLLWRFLSEHGPAAPTRMQVPLSDGLHDAVVEPVHEAGRTAYSVRLLGRRSGSTVGIFARISACVSPTIGARPISRW